MLPNETALTYFPMATTESWKDKNGTKQEKTSWHNIYVFGKLAEIAEKYLRKGQQVYIEGKIRYEDYEKNGVKMSATKIRCDNFLMLGKKNESNGVSKSPKKGAGQESWPDDYPDDDVPF